MYIYFASLQDAFFIVSIVFMGFLMLLMVATLAAILVARAKIKRKIDQTMQWPRKGAAFLETFFKGLSN